VDSTIENASATEQTAQTLGHADPSPSEAVGGLESRAVELLRQRLLSYRSRSKSRAGGVPEFTVMEPNFRTGCLIRPST